MQIVEPYAKLISSVKYHLERGEAFSHEEGLDLLKKIEWSGRISHRSEDAQTRDSWDKFLRAVVLGHGDWSIVEHASVSVDWLTDRGITHELVRHRLFSFTQESTRFVNYEKKMPPSFIRPQGLWNANSRDAMAEAGNSWREAIEACEESYSRLLASGMAPQIARSVFPNALASRVIITGNLRNWRHFFLLRTTKESHPQMRQVTIPLLKEFQEKIPILFEDIEPEARQIDNMRKPR